jgi:23S rRNA (cytosine1962-C5)-methyltransferase
MNKILITEKSKDYELLDSGEGEKLERYADFVLRRPDPQVLWSKNLPLTEWEKADAVYSRNGMSGKWEVKKEIGMWKVSLNDLTFSLKLLPSKHLGIFPEQVAQWRWLEEKILKEVQNGKKVSVLNLFGYTGGASLVCARAGASVCHVDASKFTVDATKVNMDNSGLGDKPIRLIVDDARKFVEREIKRGNKYDVVLMDPPVYGKGNDGEVWKIEEDLVPLVSKITKILSPEPLAVVLNGYASIYSSTTYAEVLSSAMKNFPGHTSHGELCIKESKGERLLPCGIFARYER